MKTAHSPRALILADVERVLPYMGGTAELKGASFFVTGGTGFVGVWLLNTLLALSDSQDLALKIMVLTRNPEKFEKSEPALASRVGLWRGDMIDFRFPDGEFKYVIHAATETDVRLIEARPESHFDGIVSGTRRVLDFAAKRGCRRLLYVSSGAVYGSQPHDIPNLSEGYEGAPDVLTPARRHVVYGEGKRVAEMFCRMRTGALDPEIMLARLFAFAGPYLPTDGHFTIGNFIKNVLNGERIVVSGDGTPYRSYMHPADMALWLLRILFGGKAAGAYNVGSDEPISIGEAAKLVAGAVSPRAEIEIRQRPVPGAPVARYVPSVDRAKQELGLAFHFDLRESIAEMLEWHRLVASETGSAGSE